MAQMVYSQELLLTNINPFTPKFYYYLQLLWCYFGEFGIGSTDNPLIDFFLILISCLLDVVLAF